MPPRRPLSERIARQRGETMRYEPFYSQHDPLDLRRSRIERVPKDRSWVVTFSIGMTFLEAELYFGVGRESMWVMVGICAIYCTTVMVVLTSNPYHLIERK